MMHIREVGQGAQLARIRSAKSTGTKARASGRAGSTGASPCGGGQQAAAAARGVGKMMSIREQGEGAQLARFQSAESTEAKV